MFWILRLVLLILLFAWVSRQVRNPSGPLGRRLVRAMNMSHSAMADWGLQQVTIQKNAAILDTLRVGGRSRASRLRGAPAACAPDGCARSPHGQEEVRALDSQGF